MLGSNSRSTRPQSQAQPPEPKRPFDIDEYLNPYVPRNPLYLLPTWLSYWFGYRAPIKDAAAHASRPHYHHHFQTLTTWASICIGAFCGLAIIENVFRALPPLSGHAVPIIIASFGAAAVLEYNTIESPLSQPRNLVLGHLLSAIVAVGITKLFAHLPPSRFEELRWLAGALAVGVASWIMSVTKTVHPPAGATALLAATNVEISDLGWWLPALVLLAAMLMLASALVLNNLTGRRFPIYWWTPVDLKALREERKAQRQAPTVDRDPEKAIASSKDSQKDSDISDADTETDLQGIGNDDLRKIETVPVQMTHTISYSSASRIPRRLTSSSEEMLDRQLSRTRSPIQRRPAAQRRQSQSRSRVDSRSLQNDEMAEGPDSDARIVITKDELLVPDWFQLNDFEDEVLRILMERLRDG